MPSRISGQLCRRRHASVGPTALPARARISAQEQHAAAEPLLRQVLELEPSFTKASLALVGVLHAQGKTTPALSSSRRSRPSTRTSRSGASSRPRLCGAR